MERWCVLAVLLGVCRANNDFDNTPSASADSEDQLLKQVVWKRCYRKISPSCLKLNLVRTVEMMSKDSPFFLVPGVTFSSDPSDNHTLPPELSRSLTSDHAPLDDLVAFTLGKYLRSLTLEVNLVDFLSGGNETLQNSVIDVFSGRGKKDGMGGYGAVAAMMGGMMASMMMAGLAALAGKALVTSLLALIMAAFSAMKGGGGGDHESKTYEVITKPMVSHVNTHSSEVQHHDHGHYRKRSLELQGLGGGSGKGKDHDVTEDELKQFIEEEETKMFPKGNVQDDNSTKDSDSTQMNFMNSNQENVHQPIKYQHQRPKRNINFYESPKSSINKFQIHDEEVNSRIPLTGHPRENHRKYKRYDEDDILFALGLFK